MTISAYIHRDKKQVVSILLRFNMQWYAKVMSDILFRYKILLLFIACILATTLSSIVNFVILPAKGFLYPVTGFVGLASSFLLFQLFSLVWIQLHQLVVLMRIPIETTIESSLQATTDSGNIRAVSAEARWHYLLSIIGL